MNTNKTRQSITQILQNLHMKQAYILSQFQSVLMLHAYTSSTDIYWRIPNTNWRAHLEQCHKNPDTLKGPGTMLNQSRHPRHIRGSVHLCKLNHSQNSGESSDHREKPFPPLRRTVTFLPIYLFWVTNCLRLVRTTFRFFFTKL